jgi:two-component system CheB/CheR fusion protein
MASKNKKSHQSPTSKTTKKLNTLEAKKPAEPTNRPQSLTVVGIGASAGGLTAFNSFFEALSPDTGMAFVVITHLHPTYESHLAELLQQHTQMPTHQVDRWTKVEADHVYVIPPNRSIIMTDTHLETAEFTEPRGKRSPIDHFFRSLASEGHESIAVILSGGGTDGSVGLKDVKERGGVIMVQHPNDAEYDSMPLAAINTGLVDVVLPADQLARKLIEYVQHRPQLPHDPGQLTAEEADTFQHILAQVQARTGQDLNQYKRSTILRRIERRMQLNGVTTLEGYLKFLRQNPNEVQSMFNDILIGVTNFFRDRESWLALEQEVIPALFERTGGSEIRAWSIGCATGEEAYGLSMLLTEETAKQGIPPHFQIFASDLDERSVSRAREGVYPAGIEADVSPERLERFFTREGNHYRIKSEIRDRVLFTNHNILRDPPFSRQDLIVCRNLLIYLQREVQDKIFDVFHYALNPDGYVFLGSSETMEHLPELFRVVDKTHRLYQAKPWQGEHPHIPAMPLTLHRDQRSARSTNALHPHPGRHSEELQAVEARHEKALESHSPPSIIINENHMVLHVSETAGRFLLQPKGALTGDVLKLVRPELHLELRAAIFHAFEKDCSIVSQPVFVQFNGHPHRVVLAVRPLIPVKDPRGSLEKEALVLFLENELDESIEVTGTDASQGTNQGEPNALVAKLRSENQQLREQLQVTTEEYESSNEEMKASNEELQSINEEYRSATEELETSKEELQSINEELQTVNYDMKLKLEELATAHQELENLLGATEVGTLFLDRELRIQRFTAGVNDIINLLPSDRGRPIGHLTHKFEYNSFMEDAEQVLRQLIPLEREVKAEKDGWYLLRFRPYRTAQDRIEGVVITFINITALKESEEELRHSKETLEDRVEERTRELHEANQKISQVRDLFFQLFYSNPIPTSLTQLADGRFMDVNNAYLEFAGLQRDEMIGRTSFELGLPLANGNQQEILERLQKENMVNNVEFQVQRASGETVTVLASIQLIMIDKTQALLMSFIDISERVRAEQQIHALAYELTKAEQTERQRISQILHDDLQQRIFAAKVQTLSLDHAYRQGDLDSAQTDLQQIGSLLDESISITRNLSIDLSPAILDGEGLSDALTWLAAQMHENYGLNVSIQTNGVSTRFEDTLRILLFQAVREALFNIVKHAETLEAAVTLKKADGHMQIIVSDEGVGFQTDTMDQQNNMGGLAHIQQRIHLIGCSLFVQSQPGNGTRVTIKVPLPPTDGFQDGFDLTHRRSHDIRKRHQTSPDRATRS